MSLVRLSCAVGGKNGPSHATVKFLIGNGRLGFATEAGKHCGPAAEASAAREHSHAADTSCPTLDLSTDVMTLLAFLGEVIR